MFRAGRPLRRGQSGRLTIMGDNDILMSIGIILGGGESAYGAVSISNGVIAALKPRGI
jgi:hypothetical protein